MDDLHTETSADAPLVANGDAAPSRPAHLVDPPAAGDPGPDPRRRRWLLPVLLVPVLLIVVLVIAWVVDTSSGGVPRNVQLAGVDIGGLTEDELAGRIGDVAADFAATPVELQAGDVTYTTTAGEIGLMVDEEDTAATALEVGERSFLLARPFEWVRSLVATREAPLRLQVDAEQVATTVVALEGDDRTPPVEPTVELTDGAFTVVPGVDGVGIDPAEVADRLPAAAAVAVGDDAGAIQLEVATGPIPPLGSEDAARRAAEDAEALVQDPLAVATQGGTRTIAPDTLRTWVRLASNPDGTVVVSLDDGAVNASLRRAFADVEGHPVNASFTLQGGAPVIRPDQPGLVCCGEGSSAAALSAMQGTDRTVELTLVEGAAPFTVEDAEAYGIKQPVGGNNAWRSGAPTTAGPGFTTYHDPTGARITNIHRIADLVRGAVIAPGDSFSINDHVGERTAAKGFVPAGAISNGEHVDEIGGGISQFATTTFNAAYFAGLPIDTYQAHSEYFDRYPRGREATMGYPAPDLRFTNDTPYGIMIWTSYTQTSLTVTLYSTPHATAAQTGSVDGTSGKCTTVTTTRTITYPDGRTAQDEFRARYRPSGSTTC
jgi:vancomycin resistance protein YoaR